MYAVKIFIKNITVLKHKRRFILKAILYVFRAKFYVFKCFKRQNSSQINFVNKHYVLKDNNIDNDHKSRKNLNSFVVFFN